MIKFRQKFYSIQEGGYKGSKKTRTKGGYGAAAIIGATTGAVTGGMIGFGANGKAGAVGAGIGAVIGAGLGAFTKWMNNIAENSIFNSGLSTHANSRTLIYALEDIYRAKHPELEEETVTENIEDKYTGQIKTVTRRTVTNNARRDINPEGIIYVKDQDPNKYTITAYYSANVLVLYINRPKNHEMSFLNKILDDYCYSFRNADYTAKQIRNGIYEVEVAVVEGTESYLCSKFVEAGFCINILVGNKNPYIK